MGICGICQEKSSRLYKWECGKSAFCKSCSTTWVKNSLSSNQPAQCISGCQTHNVSLSFVKKLVSSEPDLITKADIVYTETSIQPKDRIYCHKCAFPHSKSEANKTVLNCSKCKSNTCLKCSMPWQNKKHKCKETDLETKDSIDKAGFKQCVCGCIIERSDFCNKINCPCGRTFCYKCNSDYENGVKKCECPVYDDIIMFIMYAERLFHIITDPIINAPKHPIMNNIFHRLISSFVDMVSTYKTKMSDDRERTEIVKLKHSIFGCLMHLASFEIGGLPFSSSELKSLKDIEAIVVHARSQRSEMSILRQQLLNTYNELIDTKRKLEEEQHKQPNKKPRL